jgi:hypothetical protein
MKVKRQHNADYVYLLEPFGGQVFESGPNNIKHVTCNGLTIHKQWKDRLPLVLIQYVHPAIRYVRGKIYLWDNVILFLL